MINTENYTKDFGSGRGIFKLNLDVPRGCIYGFVGHNGAGKTTTIKMLCGLLKPDSGRASIGGVEVNQRNIRAVKKIIGYMPDITGIYDQMSVWEFLDFYGAAFKIPPKKRKSRIEEVLEITGSRFMIDYQLSSLSRGMRQKIGLAKTLVHDPDVLILDEPTSGLDPNARIEMKQIILRLSGLGKTILLSSHILPELSTIATKVVIVVKGKLLAQGTVKEISSKLQEDIVIMLTVDSDVNQAAELMRHVDGVSNVKIIDKSQIEFTYSGMRDMIGTILLFLIENKVRVKWFSENEADLENVFMKITNRAGA